MKLHKAIHTATNKPIIYVDGDTYANKDLLKSLGFSWYGIKKMWWMYSDKFSQQKLDALQKVGTDVSAYTGQASPSSSGPIQTPSNVQNPSVAPNVSSEPVIEDKTKVRTDKTTNEDRYAYTTFPINKKIYQTQATADVDGQPYILDVVIGRKQDDKRSKTMPLYTITITYNGEILRQYAKQADGRWSKNGPNYNEDAFVQTLVDQIPLYLAQKEKSKLYNALLYNLELKKRDPAFKKFLDDWKEYKYEKERPEAQAFWQEFGQKMPERFVKLTEPGYEGEYPLKLDMLGGTIYVDTGIKDQAAPYPKHLAAIEVMPEIKNLQELNTYIDEELKKDSIDIQKKYLDYLKSFAFKPEEKEEATSKMRPIAEMIMNGTIDLDMFKRELLKRQFIRPRKSRNEQAPGMVPQSGFKLIIDDKAIRDHTFARGRSKNDPDYFYTAVAYNLMRIKHHNIGFMPIFLEDAYRDVADLMKRYGYETTRNQVPDYIDKVARQLYSDLTGRTYTSWDQTWGDFYGGNWGSSEEGDNPSGAGTTPPSRENLSALLSFVQYAVSLGVDPEVAKNTPKSAYRQLAIKYHPDVNKEADPSIFVKLNNLYNALPENLKKASGNWYGKMWKKSQCSGLSEKLYKVMTASWQSGAITMKKALDILAKIMSEGYEGKIVPADKTKKISEASIQEDTYLVNQVQEKATGKAIHDLAQIIQGYYAALDTNNKKLVEKIEEALRLFLNTGDIKKSKEMTKGLLADFLKRD